MSLYVPTALSTQYPKATVFAETFLTALGPIEHPFRVSEGFDDPGLCIVWNVPRTISVYVWEPASDGPVGSSSLPASTGPGRDEDPDPWKEASGMVTIPKICSHLSSDDPVTLAAYAAIRLRSSAWEVATEELEAMPLADPRAKPYARTIMEEARESKGPPTCTFDSQTTIKLAWGDSSYVIVGPEGLVPV